MCLGSVSATTTPSFRSILNNLMSIFVFFFKNQLAVAHQTFLKSQYAPFFYFAFYPVLHVTLILLYLLHCIVLIIYIVV